MSKDTTSNNVPILRGEEHYISPKILHQAGYETTQQAATLAKCHARSDHCITSLYLCAEPRILKIR